MIVNKIKRRVRAQRHGRTEHAYMTRLSRYIVRANAEDLRKLSLVSDDQYLRDLARYAVAEGRAESVVATGALNLVGVQLEDWQAEMAALLHRCTDSADALDHWILSWRETDCPSAMEVEQAVKMFLRCQGLENCPSIWGLHGDTDNVHVHIEVLRIDCVKAARQTAGDGWDIDTAHRAKAVIEAEFPHWSREEGARYEVRDSLLFDRRNGREIGPANEPSKWSRPRRKSEQHVVEPGGKLHTIDPQSVAYELATGLMSRSRIALEIAVPIALGAKSWDEVHRRLADEGIGLQRHRSGAAFFIDGKPVKASIVRETSLMKLEQRYDEAIQVSRHQVATRPPRELTPNDPQRCRYFTAKRAHDEQIRNAVAEVRNIAGKGAGGIAVNSALGAAATAAPFPSFEAWLHGATVSAPAVGIYEALGFAVVTVARPLQANFQVSSLAGFRASRLPGRTIYRARGTSGGRPAFVDIGDKVFIYASENREAVRASLHLIASRFPDNAIVVTGAPRFQSLVLEIAEADGVRLAGALGKELDRLRGQNLVDVSGQKLQPDQAAQVLDRPSPPITEAQVPRYRGLAARAMMARVFQSKDWNPSDYWAVAVPQNGPASSVPIQSSMPEDRRVASPPIVAKHGQTSVAEQANRAASFAAASRGRGLG